MNRSNAATCGFVMMAVVTGCGSNGAASSPAPGDGGADANVAPDATADQGGGKDAAPGSGEGGVGDAAQGTAEGGGDASVGPRDGGDASTSSDAASRCGSDTCEACLMATTVSNCSTAVTSCAADATCSQALQQLWTCRCGDSDGGVCSQQCSQQCAPSFYQSGSAATLVWKFCGAACTMCAFN